MLPITATERRKGIETRGEVGEQMKQMYWTDDERKLSKIKKEENCLRRGEEVW